MIVHHFGVVTRSVGDSREGERGVPMGRRITRAGKATNVRFDSRQKEKVVVDGYSVLPVELLQNCNILHEPLAQTSGFISCSFF